MLLIQLFHSHSICTVGHTTQLSCQKVTWSLCLSYMVGRDLLFHPMIWLTLNLWWMLKLVILVCWLCTRLMYLLASGQWSASLLIRDYPGFTGKVSTLIHFPLEPGCEDYSFLDKEVKDFEQDLDSLLTDSIDTPELDASFDEADTMPSSVSSWFLCLVNTHSDNFRLQLPPTIKCFTLWCQARALF